jgi:drug/metabolite transporter (DMT)-like permease
MTSQKNAQKLSDLFIHWLLLFLCAFIWGFSYYLIKHALVGYSPLQVASIRVLTAAITLLPFLATAIRKIPLNKYLYVFICAMVGNGIPMYLYPLAQTHISSSVAGIINSFTPLCIYFTAVLFFGLPKSRPKLIGVSLGLIGVICLIVFKPQAELRAELLFLTVALCAPVSYGINANVYKKHLNGLPAVPLTSLMFAMLLLPALFFVLSSGVPELYASGGAARESLPYALLLGILGSAVAMTLFNILLKRAPIMFAASVSYLMPVVAVTMGMIDKEQVGWYEITGLAFILSGVLLINKTK